MSDIRKERFIKGAIMLAVAGLFCRILGAFYRVPLGNIIGSDGMGAYQMAFPIYSFLLVVSSAGIPLAISKLISEELELGRKGNAHRIFKVSFVTLLVIGAASSVLLYAFSEPIAQIMGMSESAPGIAVIAPSLLFVALACAFRGYFQGMQVMSVTAVTQVCEQAVKLIVGLIAAQAFVVYGFGYGAAGALLGVTASEAAALALTFGYYFAKRKHLAIYKPEQDIPVKTILAKIAKIALPVTLGACMLPVVGLIDSVAVMRILTSLGFATSEAASLFGLESGFVMPIAHLPSVVAGAVAISLVPGVAGRLASKHFKQAGDQIRLGTNLGFLIGLPSSVALFVLAEPILSTLFSNLTEEELLISANLMRIMAPGTFFLCVAQTTSGALQGMGKAVVPVLNLTLGAVFKIGIGIALISIPSINVYGAAVGNVVCFAVTAGLNLYCLERNFGSLSLKQMFPRALVSTAIFGVVIYFVYSVRQSSAGLFIALLAGLVVYVILLLLSGIFDREQLEMIPGGKKINKLMIRDRRS